MATEHPKIKLYWLEASRAQGALWLLEELKVPYELELMHRDKETNRAPPELKKVHPMGHSPTIEITPADGGHTIVLAESGFIAQYLSENFGQGTTLMPKRYQDGHEGKPGYETKEWLAFHYFVHFNEGSLMASIFDGALFNVMKGPKIPFFLRPITALVANQLLTVVVHPNIKGELEMLESQLTTSGGPYICGEHLTAPDIMMSFALIMAKNMFKTFGTWASDPKSLYPKTFAYIERLENHPGYLRSAEKIKELDPSMKIKFEM